MSLHLAYRLMSPVAPRGMSVTGCERELSPNHPSNA